jgi:hypothetical protein
MGGMPSACVRAAVARRLAVGVALGGLEVGGVR